MTPVTIAIDAMGGDFGPPITVPAAVVALNRHPHLHLILTGDQASLEAALRRETYDQSRLTIQHTTEVVAMDESPALALRSKKDSSMRVAINLIKEEKAHACVSAGNTGALMATARFVLKTLPGIDRPAIISGFPTIYPDKLVRILDLGANVDCTPQHLVQFAVMGSVLTETVGDIKNPRVCLLNIGEEDIKGNDLVKQAAQLLSTNKSINYTGYIEGDRMFRGDADVVVCDGFIGNVTLKTTEGVARLIKQTIKEAFMKNFLTKILGIMVKPIMNSFAKRLDPSHYNGAVLLGLQGNVIKSHGSARVAAFATAIEAAMKSAEMNIPERIRHTVANLLSDSQ